MNLPEIINDVSFGDILYLKTDVEQLPRIVTGIMLRKDSVCYELSCGTESSDHYSFEFTKEKTIF